MRLARQSRNAKKRGDAGNGDGGFVAVAALLVAIGIFGQVDGVELAVIGIDLDAFLGVGIPPIGHFATILGQAMVHGEAAFFQSGFATGGAGADQITHRSGRGRHRHSALCE